MWTEPWRRRSGMGSAERRRELLRAGQSALGTPPVLRVVVPDLDGAPPPLLSRRRKRRRSREQVRKDEDANWLGMPLHL